MKLEISPVLFTNPAASHPPPAGTRRARIPFRSNPSVPWHSSPRVWWHGPDWRGVGSPYQAIVGRRVSGGGQIQPGEGGGVCWLGFVPLFALLPQQQFLGFPPVMRCLCSFFFLFSSNTFFPPFRFGFGRERLGFVLPAFDCSPRLSRAPGSPAWRTPWGEREGRGGRVGVRAGSQGWGSIYSAPARGYCPGATSTKRIPPTTD